METRLRTKGDTSARTYYDYDRQCWIVDGVVDRCGHREKRPTCYSCNHAGERVVGCFREDRKG
jgi:hypothetical protein